MISSEQWQEANSRYLSAALAWLRLRLLPATPPPAEEEDSLPIPGRRKTAKKQLAPTGSLGEAAATMHEAASQMQPGPALLLVAERLGLSDFERNVLLLAVACELDTSICQGSAKNASCIGMQPSFALAMRAFDHPAWDSLSPERPLRYWRLIEFQPGNLPGLVQSTIRADERVVNFCRGLNHLDERLASSVSDLPQRHIGLPLPPSQTQAVAALIVAAQARDPLPIIQLLGPDERSKQMVAHQAFHALARRIYRLTSDSLPNTPGETLAFARLWQRESRLTSIALYIDAHDLDGQNGESNSAVRRLLKNLDGCILLATREPLQRLTASACSVHVPRPTSAEQRSLWALALPHREDLGVELSERFDFNVPDIHEIVEAASSTAASSQAPLAPLLWELCREHAQPRLDQLAQRLDPRATWEDLVLPPAETDLLHQIAAQVSQRARVYDDWGFGARLNRGLGITALFAGESGTGKTMAAEVLANELRLSLYRIDLSAVVSKYIGETEKNLRRLFDAAEDGGTILFFDEADALFGKRSEVRDSHDRYANIEVNYLLQRMEAFRGVAVLATNMRSSLDTSFTRRLRFVVTFPFPGVADRRVIWQKAFPSKTPTQALDFGRLARLNLTGGNIHCAAINAAFLAADRKSPVTMVEALTAARNELLKLDQPVVESDFLWLEPKGAA